MQHLQVGRCCPQSWEVGTVNPQLQRAWFKFSSIKWMGWFVRCKWRFVGAGKREPIPWEGCRKPSRNKVALVGCSAFPKNRLTLLFQYSSISLHIAQTVLLTSKTKVLPWPHPQIQLSQLQAGHSPTLQVSWLQHRGENPKEHASSMELCWWGHPSLSFPPLYKNRSIEQQHTLAHFCNLNASCSLQPSKGKWPRGASVAQTPANVWRRPREWKEHRHRKYGCQIARAELSHSPPMRGAKHSRTPCTVNTEWFHWLSSCLSSSVLLNLSSTTQKSELLYIRSILASLFFSPTATGTDAILSLSLFSSPNKNTSYVHFGF